VDMGEKSRSRGRVITIIPKKSSENVRQTKSVTREELRVHREERARAKKKKKSSLKKKGTRGGEVRVVIRAKRKESGGQGLSRVKGRKIEDKAECLTNQSS